MHARRIAKNDLTAAFKYKLLSHRDPLLDIRCFHRFLDEMMMLGRIRHGNCVELNMHLEMAVTFFSEPALGMRSSGNIWFSLELMVPWPNLS